MLKKAIFAATLFAASGVAQCDNVWVQAANPPGVGGSNGLTNAEVLAATWWDPDGAGPEVSRMVIAGKFTIAGTVAANNIAVVDPVTELFAPMGDGIAGDVLDLTATASGDLIAVGNFASAGGVAVANVARWDGVSWHAMGSGLSQPAHQVVALDNGDVIAYGSFASSVARWDGSAWQPLPFGSGSIIVRGPMKALTGGRFVLYAWGIGSSHGAFLYDGTSYQQLGGSFFAIGPLNFGELPSGELIAVGSNLFGGSPSINIAKWNGTTWGEFGGGVTSLLRATTNAPNGDLVVGGTSGYAAGQLVSGFIRWDGTQWIDLDAGQASHSLLGLDTAPDGRMLAWGQLTQVDSVQVRGAAVWDGTWHPLAEGRGPQVYAESMITWNGELIVGTNYVSRVTESGMELLGSQPTSADISSLAAVDGGDLYAGGRFPAIGGTTAEAIARFDGTSWHALGTGCNEEVMAITVSPTGDVFAGGWFTEAGGIPCEHVARWDGTEWHALGGGVDGVVRAMCTLPNGNLVVGGTFATAGGQAITNLACWNGSQWQALGGGAPNGHVWSIVNCPDGSIAIGGFFTSVNGIAAPQVARWDGVSWSAIGSGSLLDVRTLTALPNGDLIAAGTFTVQNGQSADYVARWDGTSWQTVLGGVDRTVFTSCWVPDGRVAISGYFDFVGDTPSPRLAYLESTCPITTDSYGSGCVGSGGLVELNLDQPAWLGGTMQSTATGLGALSLCVSVYGSQQLAVPLASIHPQGLPGCTLLANDDILLEFRIAAGVVTSEIDVPVSAAVVGSIVHHQVVPIEIDGAGHITALTASNAIRTTIGSF